MESNSGLGDDSAGLARRMIRFCSCSGFVDTGLFGFEESTMGKTRAAYPPEFCRQP
jgi:hypothetical protein